MINLNDFASFDDSYVFGEGSTLQEVQEGFASCPEWLPEDFKQLFTQCDRWTLVGVEMFSPLSVPYSPDQRAITLNDEFHEDYPGHEELFAVGEMGDDSYLVLQHLDDEIVCGYFHTGDEEWFGNKYPSLTEWAYACLEANGEPSV